MLVGNCESGDEIQQSGVPYGSVFAVALFAVRVNNIITLIPCDNRLHVLLYVDDLQVGYRH